MDYFYIGKQEKETPMNLTLSGESTYKTLPKGKGKLEKFLAEKSSATLKPFERLKTLWGFLHPKPVCRHLKKFCILENDDQDSPNPNLLVEFYDLRG